MSWERTHTSVGAVPLTQVDATLRAARTIWLATTTPEGDPHVAPVWFLWVSRYSYWPSKGQASTAMTRRLPTQHRHPKRVPAPPIVDQ